MSSHVFQKNHFLEIFFGNGLFQEHFYSRFFPIEEILTESAQRSVKMKEVGQKLMDISFC